MSSTSLPRAAPHRRGVDPAGIHAFLDAVAADRLDLHGFLLFRDDAVVAEGFWRPYAAATPHALHSATKSFTATAIGLAISEGRLTLADRVEEFFPDALPAMVGENLAAMTVGDLLTMRTGHRVGISGGAWRGLRESWVGAFLRQEVPFPPGADFLYSSATSYMLSAILTRVTGQPVHDFLAPRLFAPLGMGPMRWDLSPEGYSTGGNGLTCLAEDFLKLGVLHLNGGVWNGVRILPERWVHDATRNHVARAWLGAMDGQHYTAAGAEPRDGYGYHWWMMPGGFRASGVFGQHCLVLPAQRAVIVLLAGVAVREPRLLAHVQRHLVPALGRGADADASLAGRLAALAAPVVTGEPHSNRGADITGHHWVMSPNEDGIEDVTLRFGDDACRFVLRDGRGVHEITAGLGHDVDGETTMTGHLLHHAYQPPALRVLAQGVWPAPDRFEMTWRFVETAFTDTVICSFGEGTLRYERRVNTNAGPTSRPPILGRPASGGTTLAGPDSSRARRV